MTTLRTPQADGPLTQARLRLKEASRQRALQAQLAVEESLPSVTELVARVVSNHPLLPPVTTSASSRAIPLGWCACGCGIKTRLATRTRREYGHVKGQPLRFVPGHNDSSGRGGYSLRPKTLREAQRLAEEREAQAAAVAAAKAATKPASRTPSPVLALPIGAPGITGARYHLIEREWYRSEPFKPALRPPRPSYTGYGIKRRP